MYQIMCSIPCNTNLLKRFLTLFPLLCPLYIIANKKQNKEAITFLTLFTVEITFCFSNCSSSVYKLNINICIIIYFNNISTLVHLYNVFIFLYLKYHDSCLINIKQGIRYYFKWHYQTSPYNDRVMTSNTNVYYI